MERIYGWEIGPWMIAAEKRELALQIQALLLMARIKIMAEEIFPAHITLAEVI